MGRYRLGEIISMTRRSLSITQEQLCEDICSVETLSRIETGRQNPARMYMNFDGADKGLDRA